MSDLLPRQYEDFRKKEYWDSFFEKRSEEAFEWYGEYAQLQRGLLGELGLPAGAPAAMLHKLKKSVRVLVVGCGNSELSKQLADDGFSTLVSIDFSERVVDEMRRKHPDMRWEVMDMTDMNAFASGSFDLVVDKGALDALMASDTPEIRQDATKMLLEVQRVLAPGGRYCCVTMAQDFILRHVLTFFCVSAASEPDSDAAAKATGWAVSVREVPRDARKPFVPFLVTAAKCQRSTASARKAIYNAKPFEHESGAARQQWLTHEVEATQWYTMTQGGLKKLQVGRQEVIELIANNSSDATVPEADPVPRFTLRLVDVSMRGANGSCAVFLIPQGREHEWMFATEEGAAELAGGAGFSRLILVALGRGHQFDSTTQVQEELNAKILELAPETLGANEKIPYLTVEEGLGKRNIVHQGQSPLSGAHFIEEVDDAGDRLRRLVFLSNTNVIQSEVRLIVGGGTKTAGGEGSSKKKKKNKKKKSASASSSVVDSSYLAFDYHKGMVAALHAAWLGPRSQGGNTHRSLLIGLGGGCLAKYVHDNAPSVSMTACELDPTIVTVAEQFFGFQQDDRMNVVVADGLAYVGERATSAKESPSNDELRLDSIIVDVDAKERSVGMSCPPVAFVEDKFLRDAYALLADGGVMLLNVSCRDSALFQQILARLKLAFEGASAFMLRPSEQDVNSVVFIRKEGPTNNGPSNAAVLKQLQEYGKRRGKAAASQDLPAYVDDELCELIREIQLC